MQSSLQAVHTLITRPLSAPRPSSGRTLSLPQCRPCTCPLLGLGVSFQLFVSSDRLCKHIKLEIPAEEPSIVSNTMIQAEICSRPSTSANHGVVRQHTPNPPSLSRPSPQVRASRLENQGRSRVAAQEGKLKLSSNRQLGAQAARTDICPAAQDCVRQQENLIRHGGYAQMPSLLRMLAKAPVGCHSCLHKTNSSAQWHNRRHGFCQQ